jgi:hypothetical protein
MKHPIDLAERIHGTYWHAAAILKLDLDQVVKAPLEELRFEIGGGAITRRVRAEVGPMIIEPDSLRIPVRWKDAEHPKLFPVMDGELHISDVGGSDIELRLVGEYRLPLGAIGAAADMVAGHRVAEKSLHGFLTEVTKRLQAKLIEHTARLWVEK